MGEGSGLGLGHEQGGEHGARGVPEGDEGQDRLHVRLPFRGGCLDGGAQPLERHRRIQVNVAHARAAQRGQVGTHAERVTGVAREGAHIGARGALDDDININHANGAGRNLFVGRIVRVGFLQHALDGARGRKDLQARNVHRTRRQLDVFTGAGERVSALAVHLDRRDGRGHLHDVPAQRRERSLKLLLTQRGAANGCGRDALSVVRVSGDAEADRRPIFLRVAAHPGEQLRRLADADHEDSRGHRVQGATMPHLAGVGQASHARDHVVAGEPLRLVDDKQAGTRIIGSTSHEGQAQSFASASSSSSS